MIRLWHTAIAFATAMPPNNRFQGPPALGGSRAAPWPKILTLLLLLATPAQARNLPVGAHHPLKLPSQAAAIARNGDTIQIDPGTYHDCAIWNASKLVIKAAGPGVVIAGKTCVGMGIFITRGNDITVQGITFADAVVFSHNGAGIRAAGDNLTVENSHFLHNENGILAGGGPNSVLRITGSTFVGNGACIQACAHGVYAGQHIRLLDINHCVFLDTKVGHHIKSRARNTIIQHSLIEDGPLGTASYLIDIPNGGNVLIQGNTMEKGAKSDNPDAAISIGEEGVKNPTNILVVQDNVFHSELPIRTVFVRDSTSTPVALFGNRISGLVTPLVLAAPPH